MRQLKIFLAITIIGTSLFCCNKYNKLSDDATGADFIRGRLFLYNPISGSYLTIPLIKKTVTVAYPKAGGNYIEKTLTDTAGYFVFNNLVKGSKYELQYIDTINSLIVMADTIVQPAQDSLPFVATPSRSKNTGFELIFVDTTAQRGTVSNIQACVFTSSLLVTDSCQGSAYQLLSDAYGRVSQFGLQPMTYYVLTKSKTAALSYIKIDTIVLSQTPFQLDTIRVN